MPCHLGKRIDGQSLFINRQSLLHFSLHLQCQRNIHVGLLIRGVYLQHFR